MEANDFVIELASVNIPRLSYFVTLILKIRFRNGIKI